MIAIRTTLASLAATVALGVATFTFVMPAHAQDAATRTVSYADLDLSTAPGRATLAKRLDTAIDSVCRSSLTSVSPAEAQLTFAQCRRAAQEQANTRLAAVLGARKLAAR